MKDLTSGPIPRLLVQLALPIMAGILVQTLYFLVDLYFVSRLGEQALAGVGSAGNVMFVVLALTQVLNVGTVALISHAVGRREREEANLVFNQSLGLALAGTLLTLALGYALDDRYMQAMGADAGTSAAGIAYLHWYLPALAMQFGLTSMGAALRGTGIVKPTMLVQLLTVLLNVVLAPVLIAGWGTSHPLGAAGAGLASFLSVGAGMVLMVAYFVRLEHYVGFDSAQWAPRPRAWRKLLAIGLPSGAEFVLMFLVNGAIYWIIRGFGPAAQAAFGVGSRLMQAIFLPAMAIAFAASPLVGQNFGAGRSERVRETCRVALTLSGLLMFALTLLARLRPQWLIGGFSSDPAVLEFGTTYLRILCLNFVASGITFTCSSVFQGLGNTVPSLLSSASRVVMFLAPALWIAARPGFRIEQIWYLSVVSVALQALLSLWFLRSELRRRVVAPLRAASAGGSALAG
jgi:putative MATE family efflux protein